MDDDTGHKGPLCPVSVGSQLNDCVRAGFRENAQRSVRASDSDRWTWVVVRVHCDYYSLSIRVIWPITKVIVTNVIASYNTGAEPKSSTVTLCLRYPQIQGFNNYSFRLCDLFAFFFASALAPVIFRLFVKPVVSASSCKVWKNALDDPNRFAS